MLLNNQALGDERGIIDRQLRSRVNHGNAIEARAGMARDAERVKHPHLLPQTLRDKF
jgi:hypothetical protein